MEIISKAYEKYGEGKAWEMWISLYPHMKKENFIPFSEFYKQQIEPISIRPTEEILAEVEEIRKSLERR